jgi:hypothetical protein
MSRSGISISVVFASRQAGFERVRSCGKARTWSQRRNATPNGIAATIFKVTSGGENNDRSRAAMNNTAAVRARRCGPVPRSPRDGARERR